MSAKTNPLWYPVTHSAKQYLEPVIGVGINVDELRLGGTVYTGLSWYPEVNTFADLPAAADNTGAIYVVKTATGVYFVNRKRAGFYLSDGASWNKLGVIPVWVSGDLVGTKNGVNATFTFPNGDTPIPNMEWIFYNGVKLRRNKGYTISGGTVTMLAPNIPTSDPDEDLETMYQKV